MPLYEDLKAKLAQNDILAGIIGLGYVGLPLMHSMCSKGVKVLGFDIDPSKAERLNKGESYLDTVPGDIVKQWVDANLFSATSDMDRLKEADFIIICVPTPLDANREPDLSYVESTAHAIARTLRPGQLISLESTTYPGTMDEIVKSILEATGLKAETDFYLAYSPEREDPGNKDFHTASTPKVIGADSPEALDIATDFYGRFIEHVVPVSSSRTAEAVKLTENIFRAVNIALVNELKVIYDRMGIDIWEVVEAAKTKPFGYMPFYPGPGLGGHCIPIDPFYLTWKAREYDVQTRFIELAGEINHSMPQYVCDKTAAALGGLKDKKLLVLGVAYKKNINDQRETPAFPLIEILEQGGAQVDYYDPHIPEILPTRHHPGLTGKSSITWDPAALGAYDAVLIITDHDAVDYGTVRDNAKLVIDTRNAIKSPAENVLKA
ncbi:MAG: nucleotide sugar dehydrogenase [Rhodospirillales bacterium]|nr:nucleotide sugar dehydrogenase [Rhodospirillales bacterium]